MSYSEKHIAVNMDSKQTEGKAMHKDEIVKTLIDLAGEIDKGSLTQFNKKTTMEKNETWSGNDEPANQDNAGEISVVIEVKYFDSSIFLT